MREALQALSSPQDYVIAGDIAIHRRSHIESGATLKGPLVIGLANAVLSPGTVLSPGEVIPRLQLVEQDPE